MIKEIFEHDYNEKTGINITVSLFEWLEWINPMYFIVVLDTGKTLAYASTSYGGWELDEHKDLTDFIQTHNVGRDELDRVDPIIENAIKNYFTEGGIPNVEQAILWQEQ